jgi:hypothetical protein
MQVYEAIIRSDMTLKQTISEFDPGTKSMCDDVT